MSHSYNDEPMDYDERMRRYAKYILKLSGKKFTDDDVERLTCELMFQDYSTSYFLHNFNKTYRDVYAEMQDKNMYYDVLIYCPHAKNKDSVKKITIFNKHLLIDIGEREYRYGIVGEEGEKYYIMPGLLCVVYPPLPKDVKEILKWSVKNGLIHVKIDKST